MTPRDPQKIEGRAEETKRFGLYICLCIYMFVIRYYTYTWDSDHKIVCCILLLCFEVPEELIFIKCEKPALHTCRIHIYLLCIHIN